MNKALAIMAIWASAFVGAASTFAAPYTISGTTLTDLNTLGGDLATSYLSNTVIILTALIWVIVVGFILRMIFRKIG